LDGYERQREMTVVRTVNIAGSALISSGFVMASMTKTLILFYIAYGGGVGFGVGLAYSQLISVGTRLMPGKQGLLSGILMMWTEKGDNLKSAQMLATGDFKLLYLWLITLSAAGLALMGHMPLAPYRSGLRHQRQPSMPA